MSFAIERGREEPNDPRQALSAQSSQLTSHQKTTCGLLAGTCGLLAGACGYMRPTCGLLAAHLTDCWPTRRLLDGLLAVYSTPTRRLLATCLTLFSRKTARGGPFGGATKGECAAGPPRQGECRTSGSKGVSRSAMRKCVFERATSRCAPFRFEGPADGTDGTDGTGSKGDRVEFEALSERGVSRLGNARPRDSLLPPWRPSVATIMPKGAPVRATPSGLSVKIAVYLRERL